MSAPVFEPASSSSDSLALLAAHDIGRLAVSLGSAHHPLIRPVTYAYDRPSNSVVFRSDEGSKLYALLTARHACFEIDGVDGDSLWSVIVRGHAEPVTGADEIARFDALGLTAAVGMRHPRWMRIRAELVTGRRFALGAGRHGPGSEPAVNR